MFIGIITVSGSCLLRFFSTNFLFWETVGSLSVSCQEPVGNLSVICRPTVHRQLAYKFFRELFFIVNSWETVGSLSVSCQEPIGNLSVICRPTVHRQLAFKFFRELSFTVTLSRTLLIQPLKCIKYSQISKVSTLLLKNCQLKICVLVMCLGNE